MFIIKLFFTKPAWKEKNWWKEKNFLVERKKFGSKLLFSKNKSCFALDLDFCNKGDVQLGSKCDKLS